MKKYVALRIIILILLVGLILCVKANSQEFDVKPSYVAFYNKKAIVEIKINTKRNSGTFEVYKLGKNFEKVGGGIFTETKILFPIHKLEKGLYMFFIKNAGKEIYVPVEISRCYEKNNAQNDTINYRSVGSKSIGIPRKGVLE